MSGYDYKSLGVLCDQNVKISEDYGVEKYSTPFIPEFLRPPIYKNGVHVRSLVPSGIIGFIGFMEGDEEHVYVSCHYDIDVFVDIVKSLARKKV